MDYSGNTIFLKVKENHGNILKQNMNQMSTCYNLTLQELLICARNCFHLIVELCCGHVFRTSLWIPLHLPFS